ncbi:DUF3135 domain-containing protein [Rheinheimera sp.]|uniref:DUF3135 domain-containing protein n=1 Tax=Rheinheimera sp. TaxID=1869214 RepID=UPI003AF48D34
MTSQAYPNLPSFDELLQLANKAPQQLELLQQKLNLELLEAQSSAENRLAMERLLFRMNARHRHCAAPLVRLQRTYELMLGHINLMQQQLELLSSTPASGKSSAAILEFPHKKPFSDWEK